MVVLGPPPDDGVWPQHTCDTGMAAGKFVFFLLSCMRTLFSRGYDACWLASLSSNAAAGALLAEGLNDFMWARSQPLPFEMSLVW